MKYYIIAGEASGDLHASNLIKSLKSLDDKAEIRAWAGDLSAAQGAILVKHYRDLAFMGFKEVIVNLRTIMHNIHFCKQDISQWQPDVIIFVDYPGFNLRIAEWARQQKYKTVYYISPQIWAWKSGRAHKIKRDIDKMLVILPFEEEFYSRYNYKVEYVGHPLLDVTDSFQPSTDFKAKNGLDDRPIIALLPGSRKQELLKKLPIMLGVCSKFPQYQFVVAGAPAQEESFYRKMAGPEVKIVFGKTYDLLAHSQAALVTSGTATLETALLGIPEVVCYKGSKISYSIGKRLVKIKFISLVNLIMDRLVVKELIQDDLTVNNLTSELKLILDNEQVRSKMIADFIELKARLGGAGASMRAGESIWKFLRGGAV